MAASSLSGSHLRSPELGAPSPELQAPFPELRLSIPDLNVPFPELERCLSLFATGWASRCPGPGAIPGAGEARRSDLCHRYGRESHIAVVS